MHNRRKFDVRVVTLLIMRLFRRFGVTCYVYFESELGSGECGNSWVEKYVDYIGSSQGLWSIRSKELKE
jgi:hypothetical protein